MMGSSLRPEDVLRRWRDEVVPGCPPDEVWERRQRLVPALATAIRLAPSRRAARLRWGIAGGLFGAAAAAAVTLLALRAVDARGREAAAAPSGAVELASVEARAGGVEAGGTPLAVGAGRPLSPHGVVATGPEGRAALRLSGGAQVTLAGGTRARIACAAAPCEDIELSRGSADVEVPMRSPASRFVLRTPDVEVLVRGTAFSVEIVERGPRAPGATRVRVTEGVVVVRQGDRESTLAAGEEGNFGGAPAPEAPPGEGALRAPAADAPETPAAAPSSPGTPAGRPPAVDARAAAQLAEQNALFGAAVAARRRGDDETALRLLDELLRRFPHGPLSQEARVERFRALRRLGDHAAAAREARRYLGEHGDGYAREEARGLAIEPSPR